MNTLKIAVFGGSGFLGGYLVDELVKANYKITIFDLVKNQENNKNLQTIILDSTNRSKVIENIIEHQFDIVFNLSGFANLENAIKEPYETFNLNVLGNINILDGCVQAKVKRFIYASSAYAMSDKGSFYGISKLASEKIIEEYKVRYGLCYTILRYGSVYSEKSFENNYIYNLIEKAIETGYIVHGGDGNEMREYIHALDVAKLSVKVMESEEYINEHIIFTGIEKIKRIDLFELIKEILGDKISIELNNGEYTNHYKLTPYSYTPSLSRKLIANPHIDMSQGIIECIKAIYRNHPEYLDK